jgi:enoyl-CoA hydratase/carnithine racemase
MELLTDIKKRVLHLTLNRPDKRNALTAAMCRDIVDQVEGAQTNPDIGSILITANGSVFCAGMDLDEIGPGGPDVDHLYEKIFTVGIRSVKPIVVGVNGAALGGGLGLVAQGDVVMCSDKAVFVYRSVEAAIGNRSTLQAALTGHLFHPEDAVQWGLVHKICPAVELLDRVKVMARELAKASPEAIMAGLEYVKRSRDKDYVEAGKLASELRTRVTSGADFTEGVAAFKEKREPRWPSIPPGFYDQD